MSSIKEQSKNQLGFSVEPILQTVAGNLNFSGREPWENFDIDPPSGQLFAAPLLRRRLVVWEERKKQAVFFI